MFRLHTRIVFLASLCAAQAQAGMIGINVLLNTEASDEILADLEAHGQVLDVILEINAVTMKAQESELPAIQALSYVAGANPNARRYPTGEAEDLSDGANHWSLDAINVTDFGGGRSVAYGGAGVYVAVLDTGLVHNWREYFPEERIATQFARSFAGGGGLAATVSSQPNTWEHDTEGHGTWVVSLLLGFRYHFSDPPLPEVFNGVAPQVTIIPVNDLVQNQAASALWSSTATHSIMYVTDLKLSGALGDAPVVINMSQGGSFSDIIEEAAIQYATDNGIVLVAAAGNAAGAGMLYPGAYPAVISAAASGWAREFPLDDPTLYEWIIGDVPEGDASEHFIAPYSSWELPGQDLDVAAPAHMAPVACTVHGFVDYSFFAGTSSATPHVAGVVALMLEKNPDLTAAEIEAILEETAMPLPPGCRDVRFASLTVGPWPSLSNHFHGLGIFDLSACWGANAAGAGLVQADAALEATPWP